MELQTLLKSDIKIPPTPQILPKLQAVLRNTECSVFDIISVVKVDASITAKVIQASNSAFYGATDPCQSLEEAVNRIGITETYRIVSIIAATQSFGEGLPAYGLGEGELLENSLVTAILMTEIAIENPDINADAAYTAGLMHSFGKVIINQYLVDTDFDSYDLSNKGPLDIQKEHELLGYSFIDAGAAILAEWNFPPAICDAIKHQYDPLAATENKAMACLLTMAISALYIVQQQDEKGEIAFEGDPQIMGEIPISQAQFVECIDRARVAFQEIRELIASF